MVEEKTAGTRLFLAGISVQPGNRIFVYIDGDSAVTIGDCQELSRYIESRLDRSREDYDLTVSSAGIDTPLQIPRQYPKNVGEILDIVTREGQTLRGILVHAGEHGIVIEQENRIGKKETEIKRVELGFDQIRSAKVEVRFKKQEKIF